MKTPLITKPRTRRNRLDRIERRIEFLDERIEGATGHVPHFDIAEVMALEWLVAIAESAVELSLIDALERHAALREEGMP